VPLSRGGSHTASNIVPACRSCNSSKGARSLMQYLMLTTR
jgi:5-methylcytosine-specific restriction endonuclease McrA